MLWLLLLPFRLLLALVFGLIALPLVVVLLPVALLLWLPFVLLKVTFRLVAAALVLPILGIVALVGVFLAGAAALALFAPLMLLAGAAFVGWRLSRPVPYPLL